MEPRPTHLAARPSGIEASAVAEGRVHTLTPVEAGEQVCKGDRRHLPVKPRLAEPIEAAPPSGWNPRPQPSQSYMELKSPSQVAPAFLSS